MMKAALARTPPALSRSAKKRWYIARKNGQSGPHSDVELAGQAGDDAIEPGDLVWRPGFLAWMRADEVPGLLSPPPLPERVARQTDRGEALRLVVTNDRELASPAAPVDGQDGPAARLEKAAEASRSPADVAPQPASPRRSAMAGGAAIHATHPPAALDILHATPPARALTPGAATPSADAISTAPEAAAAASVAEGAADLGPDGHTGMLDGPNFEKLRALLEASHQAAAPAATASPRNYASLRSLLKQQGAAPGSNGSPMSGRRRALGSTTMRVLTGALLGGVAASCVYAAFFGSRTLDVAWLWLQAFGIRLL